MIHDFNESPTIQPNMSFGEIVRKKRRYLGLNQTDFGERLGIDQHTISDYERGIKSPHLDTAMYILKRIGCEMVIREAVVNEN